MVDYWKKGVMGGVRAQRAYTNQTIQDTPSSNNVLNKINVWVLYTVQSFHVQHSDMNKT